jgi:hypothetical protein
MVADRFGTIARAAACVPGAETPHVLPVQGEHVERDKRERAAPPHEKEERPPGLSTFTISPSSAASSALT